MIPPLLMQAKTAATCSKPAERWKRIEPLIREDLQKDEIEAVPRNLAGILAKVHTDELPGRKGLFLCGNSGTGKTRRIKWMADAFEIRFITARKLCSLLMECRYEDEREDALNCLPCRWSEIPPHFGDLVIDDLGTEPDGQVLYGTQVSVLVDGICRRYEMFPRWKTHFTSNLTEGQIRARYGERVWSRLQEMCVFITLAGNDRRVKQQ